jgi:phage shock protein A
MNIFKRLFNIGKAEAHSAVDKLEDPIKMTEQGIRDMKKDLDGSLKALAEVKALQIRSRNDLEMYGTKAKDYEKKAMMLLQRGEKGEMSPEDVDRLASECLVKKEDNLQQAARCKSEVEKLDKNVNNLDKNVKGLRSQISKWENELRTLKARVKVAESTKRINKQMANIDSGSTVSMLERMREKVAQDEALAESYGEIANESRSLDDEIDTALDGAGDLKASDELAAMKAKLGIGSGSAPAGGEPTKEA